MDASLGVHSYESFNSIFHELNQALEDNWNNNSGCKLVASDTSLQSDEECMDTGGDAFDPRDVEPEDDAVAMSPTRHATLAGLVAGAASQAPKRPLIQDSSGRELKRSPTPGYTRYEIPVRNENNDKRRQPSLSDYGHGKPIRQTNAQFDIHHTNSNENRRSSSSSVSSTGSAGKECDQNRQSIKDAQEDEEQKNRDRKIWNYIIHLIPSPDVPELAKTYQWWSLNQSSTDFPQVLRSLSRTCSEEQMRTFNMMFRAFLDWDKMQDEEGAPGFIPAILSGIKADATEYYEVFSELKFLSSRALNEIEALSKIEYSTSTTYRDISIR